MKYSIVEFKKGLENLEYYVNGIYKHGELFGKIRDLKRGNMEAFDQGPLLKDTEELLSEYFRTSNKVFEYNSIIVSLYGLLENFIESLIKEYIEYLESSIPKYNDLPQNIVKNHYELSANLINNLGHPKYKDLTTKESIVSNLYSCLNCNGEKNYKVNKDAFIHHTSNFRDKYINQFFNTVGISTVTGLMLSNITFKNYLDEIGVEFFDLIESNTDAELLIGDNKAGVTIEKQANSSKAFEILNDLAERRNKVSHGSVVDDILDIDELKRYINYIKVFVECLNTVVFEQAIPCLIQHGDNIRELGRPIQGFTDKIMGMDIHGFKVAVNNTVFVLRNDEKYIYCKIESLRISGTDYSEVDATNEHYEVGVRFDRKVKEDNTFYLVIDEGGN